MFSPSILKFYIRILYKNILFVKFFRWGTYPQFKIRKPCIQFCFYWLDYKPYAVFILIKPLFLCAI